MHSFSASSVSVYPGTIMLAMCKVGVPACRLANDLNRAKHEGWRWGAKLVRGAYMHGERARAQQLGLADPIWPSLEDTHASYNG